MMAVMMVVVVVIWPIEPDGWLRVVINARWRRRKELWRAKEIIDDWLRDTGLLEIGNVN